MRRAGCRRLPLAQAFLFTLRTEGPVPQVPRGTCLPYLAILATSFLVPPQLLPSYRWPPAVAVAFFAVAPACPEKRRASCAQFAYRSNSRGPLTSYLHSKALY